MYLLDSHIFNNVVINCVIISNIELTYRFFFCRWLSAGWIRISDQQGALVARHCRGRGGWQSCMLKPSWLTTQQFNPKFRITQSRTTTESYDTSHISLYAAREYDMIFGLIFRGVPHRRCRCRRVCVAILGKFIHLCCDHTKENRWQLMFIKAAQGDTEW